jgi:transposase
MLTVERCFMIKHWYQKGLSISEIARLTGHDRKTIRKALEEPLTPTPPPRKPRVRKLDPYVAYLEQRIAEGVLNARKLYGEIKRRGYAGKETQVRLFVQPFRQAQQQEACVRFETNPGQQGQVDWGHFGLIQHLGRSRRLYAFVMTLGWSRAMYVEFTTSKDVAHFLRCHLHAFHYFGGVPREILHDNLKTAVLSRDADRTIHWNPRYLDFADYYGFVPRPCQPYRAQTKGKVESGIKYLRRNFWVGLKYIDLADLNLQAWEWLETVANVRLHGTTGEIPFARLPLEELQPILGKPDYDTSLVSYRRSSKDCLISYQSNYYSIPAPYAQQQLLVKETEDGELLIFTLKGEQIARHHLVEGRNQRVVISTHYRDITIHTQRVNRPGAIQLLAQINFPLDRLMAPAVEARPLSIYDAAAEVAE